jgi:hypothetical protein
MPRRREAPRRRPPQRSLYRKLHIVLTEADRGEANSLAALTENLQARGYPDFTRYAPSGDGTSTVVPCSVDATRRAVELAVALGLIQRETGRATRRGSQGIDLERFDRVLAEGVEHALTEAGTPLTDIRRVAAQLLEKHAPGSLPTWENIADAMKITEARELDRFRTCLSLLEACGRLEATRRKIYTP